MAGWEEPQDHPRCCGSNCQLQDFWLLNNRVVSVIWLIVVLGTMILHITSVCVCVNDGAARL
jgi:hypothetical protein